ncbi:MAG: septum formation initiator family protein [Dehalococcoidia bacterium]
MAALHRPALPAPRAFGRRVSGRTVLVVAAFLAVGVATLQVNQFSRATSASYTIDALARERAMKQAQNHELEGEVAQLSSLGRIEWDARARLGLVPAQRTVYLTVNQAVPDGQSLPMGYQQQAAAPAAGPKTAGSTPLWKRLLKLIPFF